MKRILALIVASVWIAGCTDGEPDMPAPGEQASRPWYRISPRQAVEQLDELLGQLYGPHSRAATQRTIASIDAIGGQQLAQATRADDRQLPDSLYYLINFDDSLGFAILAADARLEIPVIAVTEKGRLSKEDFIPTDAEDFYSEENVGYLLDTLNEDSFEGYGSYNEFFRKTLLPGFRFHWRPDTTVFKKHGPDNPERPKVIGYELVNRQGPLLKTLWCQDEPFNNYCPLFGDKRAPAGCIPVAVAQIFNYFRHPSGYDGLDFHWDEVNRIYNIDYKNYDSYPGYVLDYAADDLLKIGRACKAEYKPNGTSVNIRDAKRFMDKRGYSGTELHSSKLQARIEAMINNGKPVPMRGKRKENGDKKGHCWVVDGYAKRVKTVDGQPVYTGEKNLLHCNMGWHGLGNGYYAVEMFDVWDPVWKDEESGDKGKPQDHYVYYFQFKIITYYKP